MKITLGGAAGGEVTGSAYLLEANQRKVLFDCGLFQGARAVEKWNRFDPKWKGVDAVVLTHAHLDHTGRLPLLTRAGFHGPVYATAATHALTDLILKDAAKIQENDTEKENRRRHRRGMPPIQPIYRDHDVDQIHRLAKPMDYDRTFEAVPGVEVRAVEAGHMLGSTSLEVTVEENGKRSVVVFSGDIGPRNAPVHRDPTPFKNADILFMESTYGDRDHRSLTETLEEAIRAIKWCIDRQGKVLVPSFAIGRTQLLLYLLAGAFQRGALPQIPVYVDSPMAIEATRIYAEHVELFDEEALAMQRSGSLAQNLESVVFTPSAQESRALNERKGPCVILAGSGMCNAGRILHHMRHNLARPETLVLFVGFQSHGSLGRNLIDGAKRVRIFGENIPVKARISTLGGLSGHAGQTDLLHWLGPMANSRPRVYLTHGEERGRAPLGRLIQERHGLEVNYPNIQDVVE